MSKPKSMADMFGGGAPDTFMGLPKCDDLDRLHARIALIGAPAATPYASVGAYCSGGPKAIRQAIAEDAGLLAHHDFELGGPLFPDGNITAVDCGDLDFDESDAAGNRDRIRNAVRTIVNKKAVPVVIGGDDSVPIPMLEALAETGPHTIVQIDAHIDWRDDVNGERLGLSSTMRRASEMAHIERIIQVGQRAVGSARSSDHEDALKWGVNFVSAHDLHVAGIHQVLDLVPEGSSVIIALDWDALDPSIMPAVIGRAPGGMTYWQTVDLIAGIAAKARIAAVDTVEFMPDRDIDQIGGLTAARVLVNIIGLLARQAAIQA